MYCKTDGWYTCQRDASLCRPVGIYYKVTRYTELRVSGRRIAGVRRPARVCDVTHSIINGNRC